MHPANPRTCGHCSPLPGLGVGGCSDLADVAVVVLATDVTAGVEVAAPDDDDDPRNEDGVVSVVVLGAGGVGGVGGVGV